MPACLAKPSLAPRREDDRLNGPMQHRLGHECALCDAHSKAAERHTARPHVRTKRYLPWIAPLALCVVLIPFVDGAARGLFAGIVVEWDEDDTEREGRDPRQVPLRSHVRPC